MRSIAFFIVTALIVGPAMARTPVKIGDQVIVNKATLGCPKLSDMRRVLELSAIQQDEDAALKLAERQGCRQILAGTIGLIEKSGRPNIIVDCMRPRGEPDCFWIARLRLTVVEPVDYDPFRR
ncbi:hypothetical protein [Bradyrhizobium diazoefficiens]|uniref:Uncharacterized protein n=1 Tax=Bradyrhizobium diazoefficiens TaxID=1355477 RepID=A0A810BFR9_9BRAD|nr:hypothetical protein [Bradyrhizobium diazoefficiens]WLB35601.1 hypothetical protein QIH78_29530 [Bradyrhizobium diazoefficiens]WLC19407.1 hypothetical protein QIH76_14140 [Bradyrhizobium diazoefficiens]BCE75556.1 hypothetical protein XF8B_56670 [Bradyrhizobium diazoefficiens]